jgi:hypothetical protein
MDQNPGNNDINLDNILLPKKEERTPASASRVNAGVLLETEQGATLPKPVPAAPPPAPPKPEGPKDESTIAPLETYQKDMESVISQKNISAVSIAAAEANRASSMTASPAVQKKPRNWKWLATLGAIVAGVTLVVAALGFLAYVLTRPAPAVTIGTGGSAPFMDVDDTQALVLTPDQLNHATLMQNLESLKENTSISLGLVSRMYVIVSSTTVEKGKLPDPISAQTLLATLAPNIGDSLLRTIDPNYYLLGVHVFDGNQEFLVLKVDSYEQAFSGMLDWERTMATELSPLFSRTPRPRTPEELNAISTSTPTTTIPTSFRDKIVANHDARAVINDQGDVLLLWAFIDRNTLVITTNESTLSEIISRKATFTPAP